MLLAEGADCAPIALHDELHYGSEPKVSLEQVEGETGCGWTAGDLINNVTKAIFNLKQRFFFKLVEKNALFQIIGKSKVKSGEYKTVFRTVSSPCMP